MSLFIHVLADVVHLVAIIILCNVFFCFKKRNEKYYKIFLAIAILGVSGISAFIYLCNNDILESLVYVAAMIFIICSLYKEKVTRGIIVTISMLLTLSMIDTMLYALFNIFMDMFAINEDMLIVLCASACSLLFIVAVGRIYRKNATKGLQTIGIVNIIGFIVLLAVDTFVVTVMTHINVDLYMADNKKLYSFAVVLVIIGIFIQLASVILLFTQRNVYKEKEELTDKYLNEQKNHYEYLEEREKETRKFRHDLRNHMEIISKLAKERQYDRMNAYLEQMNIKINDFGNVVTVQNGIVDAVLNQYYAKAKECGVSMEVKGRFPVDCAIDAFDLCTIFSNVLSNALEAAKETEEKRITVECAYTDMVIMLIVINSYKFDGPGGGQLRTRKSDLNYHGYGLENVKDSFKKYKGGLDIETKDNIFTMRILFKNMEKQVDENSNCR